MPIDPHVLKPAELVQLMNSTKLGAVINRDRVYRHRDQGGLFIGNGETIDLIRYTGWLFSAWLARRDDNDSKGEEYARRYADRIAAVFRGCRSG